MQYFYMYILRCRDGSYYVGHTDNIELRLGQHQSGLFPGYTSRRRPVELVYNEMFTTRDDAFAAEMQVKSWSRAKKEGLIRGDWKSISEAARKTFKRS